MITTGSTLGGRYTIGASIASGGMGDVWEATDEVLQRPVAVKVMRPQGPDDSFLERFRDEARGNAALHHPNIAQVFDYGEDDGTAYLVMELVPGRTLSELIRESGGGMAPDDVRSIIGQAALALATAHESGVVHRDVKPANIIVTPHGQVKLTDFGIARLGDGSGHTVTGEVLGTPHYISPEQALGDAATPASDIYALGIVAYEMLTGAKPFDQGMPVATALAQVNDEPPPLPESVPADLRGVVESCLAKQPSDRPADARVLAATVGEAGADQPAAPGGVPADPAHDAPLAPQATTTLAGATPLAAADPTRAMPVQTRRAEVREGAARGRQSGERHVSRRWAWLAVPAVALIAWGAFALGGLVNGVSTASSTGTPSTSASAASTTTAARASTTTSTPPKTTTSTKPTSSTTSTSQEPAHPGKGKGRGKGK